MSPLNLEAYNPQSKEWVTFGVLRPGDRPGSISNNEPNDIRDIYLFECASDDSESVIKRSRQGLDLTAGSTREIISISGWEEVARLREGQEYQISIKSDSSPEPRQIRFTHRGK